MTQQPTTSALDKLLAQRRSVRRFKAAAVPESLISELLGAAVAAPSASNKQPWRWLVLSNPERIRALADSIRAATHTIATHVPEASQAAFLAYGEYFTRFEHAPTTLIPICRGHAVLSQLVDESLAQDVLASIQAMERQSALVSTSLGLMNLLLKATELGLGASAMTGPLVAAPALKQLLGVAPSWSIVALVPVGFPDEEPKVTPRKPLEHVVRWLK